MKKYILTTMAVALSLCMLQSCGGFMQGLASGLGSYGGGGYYMAPSYNTVAAPATVWSTPSYDFNNTWTTAPATYSSGTTTYSSGSSSSSTSSSSSGSSRSCRVCYGSGKCRTCNGNGKYFDDSLGNGSMRKCPNCTNGLCTSCGGTGRK